jgi:hypothetical protein
MFDTAKRRTEMIELLVAAIGIANEIGDSVTAYLIESALDEARASAVPGVEKPLRR